MVKERWPTTASICGWIRRQKGVLIIDASQLIELNGTALDYVRCVLEGRSEESMYRYMGHRYKNLDRATAAEHYAADSRPSWTGSSTGTGMSSAPSGRTGRPSGPTISRPLTAWTSP